ncbi:MAG: hypothetical protein R3C59_13840 [Planctomycetaceae bacterium]
MTSSRPQSRPPEDADSNAAWKHPRKAIEIAQKALNGHDDPKAARKLRMLLTG